MATRFSTTSLFTLLAFLHSFPSPKLLVPLSYNWLQPVDANVYSFGEAGAEFFKKDYHLKKTLEEVGLFIRIGIINIRDDIRSREVTSYNRLT